jgi:hypothetical protein
MFISSWYLNVIKLQQKHNVRDEPNIFFLVQANLWLQTQRSVDNTNEVITAQGKKLIKLRNKRFISI